MRDNNLFKLWNANDGLISSKTPSIDLERKSTALVQRILNQSKIEIILGTTIGMVSGFSCAILKLNFLAILFFISSTILILSIMIFLHLRVKKSVFSAQQQDVKAAFVEYKRIVKQHKSLIEKLVYLFVPIIFYVTLIFSWDGETSILLPILLSLPFLIGFYFLEFKPYIDNNYNYLLQQIQSTLSDLS